MDILLFGMQGSGKGTQARILTDRYNLAYFETGAALRKLAQQDSHLGKKVKSIIEKGNLVPNEVVITLVENFISTHKNQHIIFDGIPRKKEQAESLEKILYQHNRSYLGLLIDISEKNAQQRLTTRRSCPICKTIYPKAYQENKCRTCKQKLQIRSDDNPHSIKTRIEAYKNETLPVIEKYKTATKLLIIDGEPSIEEVTKELIKALDRYFL